MENAAQYMAEVPREEQERRGRIRTFTGKLVDPLDLQFGDIDIRDIAHHMSNLCRYTGAVPQFYSVAQHSVIVANYPLKAEERAAGLLHDAAEAYLNDLASPIKRGPGFKAYVAADVENTEVIFRAFGLDPALLAKIKTFDNLAFEREVMSFWPTGTVYKEQLIVPVSPAVAEAQFLSEFRSLFPDWDGASDGLGLKLRGAA